MVVSTKGYRASSSNLEPMARRRAEKMQAGAGAGKDEDCVARLGLIELLSAGAGWQTAQIAQLAPNVRPLGRRAGQDRTGRSSTRCHKYLKSNTHQPKCVEFGD